MRMTKDRPAKLELEAMDAFAEPATRLSDWLGIQRPIE
jgi:hypothetical protein